MFDAQKLFDAVSLVQWMAYCSSGWMASAISSPWKNDDRWDLLRWRRRGACVHPWGASILDSQGQRFPSRYSPRWVVQQYARAANARNSKWCTARGNPPARRLLDVRPVIYGWNPHEILGIPMAKYQKKTWSLLLEKKHSHFSWSHLWHINKFYNYNYILYIYWGCGLATLTFYGSRKSQGIILGFAMSLWNSWEVLISIFANDLICLGIPEFDQKIDLYTQWPATHGDGARCLVPPWSSVVHKQAWDETIKRRHWGCTVDIPSWLWGWASAFAKMWMNGMQGKSALRTLLNMSIMIIMS